MLEHEGIIIKGITTSGEDFRPADWADRLAGRLCRFVHRKMVYSPLLKPCIINGIRGLYLAPQLAVEHPSLFWDLINFAHINKLQIFNQSTINLDSFGS